MAILIPHTHSTELHGIQRPDVAHHEEQRQPLPFPTDGELDAQRQGNDLPRVTEHYSSRSASFLLSRSSSGSLQQWVVARLVSCSPAFRPLFVIGSKEETTGKDGNRQNPEPAMGESRATGLAGKEDNQAGREAS